MERTLEGCKEPTKLFGGGYCYVTEERQTFFDAIGALKGVSPFKTTIEAIVVWSQPNKCWFIERVLSEDRHGQRALDELTD